jgi:16S rRNA G966 N2-methylase RsmD
MPDRVKQAIFDMLASRYDSPGALPPLFVADVFAGGGSMGLEALSRGAAFCSFFERDLKALEALRGNIESLGAGPNSRVVAGDAWRASMAMPTKLVREGILAPTAILAPAALIFLDPPYKDCEDTTERGQVYRFLRKLGDSPAVGSLVVLHHPAGTRFVAGARIHSRTNSDDPWQVAEERRIGSNAVTFFAS